MIKTRITSLFLVGISIVVVAQQMKTPYEKGNGNQTTTYAEMLQFFDALDKKHESIKVETMGEDDNGEPIKLVLFSADGTFDLKRKNKSVLLINNGIHPGEPDGIDASMMMLRDFAEGRKMAPKNIIIASIQTYNISGMLNRTAHSRANQNGPEEYGFRGNARNFDLNRDFIKADSKNAASFQKILHYTNPIYFIDNHVSNGADYQYAFTYISTNRNRLGEKLGSFLHDEMQPAILKKLEEKKILHVPYVNIHGDVPDVGFPAFMDSPRYATGYTTLFNIPGVVVETHMLKPYATRVAVTEEYMLSTINYLEKNWENVRSKQTENFKTVLEKPTYPIQWKLDSTRYSQFDFKGFEAGYKPSEISGSPRLFYDRNKPFSKKIKFFDQYQPVKSVSIPKFYVIPQSEWKVLEHLKRNAIEMKQLKTDSSLAAQIYYIDDFQTVKSPYEGHYLHFDTKVKSNSEHVKLRKGDYLVSTKQNGIQYLLETLEPEAVDSFFNWNFFDAILGQKEYYSAYVFEDTAAELFKTNPKLKTQFEQKKASDPVFAKDPKAQLDWVYKNSDYFEKTFRRYPIYRIL